MARLQILELPEGSGDDRPPFVLVIDRVPTDEAAFDAIRRDLLADGSLAEKIGARAILCFEETIDIPANDTSAFAVDPNVAAWTEADKLQARAAEGVRLAHERTDIARDMDRLANHKAALTDALGMDRLCDWDDILNAAAGLRQSRDSMRDAIQRVRDLPDRPELMNAQQPNPTDYLHGYRMAILDAKQATREPEQARNTSGD